MQISTVAFCTLRCEFIQLAIGGIPDSDTVWDLIEGLKLISSLLYLVFHGRLAFWRTGESP